MPHVSNLEVHTPIGGARSGGCPQNFRGGVHPPPAGGVNKSLVSPAKTAAPIVMPFGLRARISPRNHVLDGGLAVLRDVAMATNLWTNIAINWLCVDDSD